MFRFQEWRTQNSWFVIKPSQAKRVIVWSQTTSFVPPVLALHHLLTVTSTHAFFRLWTHLCISYSQRTLWLVKTTEHTTSNVSWSHSINTNENNHSRVLTLCLWSLECVSSTIVQAFIAVVAVNCGVIHVTVIKPWVVVCSTVWNQSQCFVIMPSVVIRNFWAWEVRTRNFRLNSLTFCWRQKYKFP